MSKSVNVRFTVKELHAMLSQAEKHNTTLVDVEVTPTGIANMVRVKAVARDAVYVPISDYDSW